MNFNDVKYLVTQTYKEWSEDKVSRLAASMAYYTVFSVAPLLVLTVIIAAQFFDTAAVRVSIEEQMRGLLGGPGADVISEIMTNAEGPSGGIVATVASVATLVFGASGVFAQLQDTLNTVWGVQADPNRGFMGTIKDRFFSFTMVFGVGFLLLVSLLVSTFISFLNEMLVGVDPAMEVVARLVNLAVSLAITTGLFAAMFKVIPDVEIEWRDVLIGAFVTAVLFTVGKWLIGMYLGNSATDSTFGAFGSLIALLAWVYYSAQIVFMGAEFTQVYATKYGSKIVPDESAVSLTEKMRLKQGMPGRETLERLAREEQAAVSRGSGYTAQQSVATAYRQSTTPQEKPSTFQTMITMVLFGALWYFFSKDERG